jgi:hypothetical protein
MLTMTNLLPGIPSVLSSFVNLGRSRLLSSAIHPAQSLFTTSNLCFSVPAPRADPNPLELLNPNGDQPESRTQVGMLGTPSPSASNTFACPVQGKAPG